MTASSAAEYADSLAMQIKRRCEAGAPFGYASSRDDMGTYDTEAEAIEQGVDADDVTEATGWDYLSEVLDIQYIVNSDRTYRGARICVAFGGPTAWINTQTSQLECAWWSATEYRDLPHAFISGLDDALEELWGMGA